MQGDALYYLRRGGRYADFRHVCEGVLQLQHCRYGEAWAPGDIVGCGIDLIKGEVSFWRNGVALGVASAEVAKGPGIAYVLRKFGFHLLLHPFG
jgi:hypothetical protein